MTGTDGFDAEQGFPVFRLSFRAIAEGIAGNGTEPGGMALSHSSGMDVSVSSGTAVYNGSTKAYGGSTLTVPSSDADDDRWDAVLFDFPAGSVRVDAGAPEQYPSPPAPGADDVVIGYVYVAAGSTSLDPSWVLDWTAEPAGASDLVVSDPNGVYSSQNLAGALSVLETAGKISQYPLDMATDTQASAYPLANSDLANTTVSVNAGTALTTTNAAVGLGGSATLDVSGVTDSEIDAGTTISRGKLDDTRASSGVKTADYTTSDEEVVPVDTSGGSVTVTLASADAQAGNFVVVSDVGGAAEASPITVATEGVNGETIDGGSSVVIESPYGARVVYSYDGTNWATAGGGAGGGAALVTTDDGATVNDPTETLTAGPSLEAADSGGSETTIDRRFSAAFEGRESGSVPAGESGVVAAEGLPSSSSVVVRKAGVTTVDGSVVPSGVDLLLGTLNGDGTFTTQATLGSGDGSASLARLTGDPLGAFTNSSGGEQVAAVIVDNTTASAVSIAAHADGYID